MYRPTATSSPALLPDPKPVSVSEFGTPRPALVRHGWFIAAIYRQFRDRPRELAVAVAARNAERAELGRQVAQAMGVAVTQTVVAGVPAYRVDPLEVDPRHTNRLFVHVHGGAWILGAGLAGTGEAVRIAGFLHSGFE